MPKGRALDWGSASLCCCCRYWRREYRGGIRTPVIVRWKALCPTGGSSSQSHLSRLRRAAGCFPLARPPAQPVPTVPGDALADWKLAQQGLESLRSGHRDLDPPALAYNVLRRHDLFVALEPVGAGDERELPPVPLSAGQLYSSYPLAEWGRGLFHTVGAAGDCRSCAQPASTNAATNSRPGKLLDLWSERADLMASCSPL